jgi:hypothetical protein
MAVQPYLRATSHEVSAYPASRRSSTPIYINGRNKFHNNDPITCCSGGGVHGCGCGCKGCNCRFGNFNKNDSTRQVYPGQGGGRQEVSTLYDSTNLTQLSTSTSSFGSSRSGSVSSGSSPTGLEARAQYIDHYVAAVGTHFNGYSLEEEEDGHGAWQRFGVSPADSMAHMNSSGIIPGLQDSSELAISGNLSATRGMLDSYTSSWPYHSDATSEVIANVGAMFNSQRNHMLRPLQLSPDCRHSGNTSICSRCVH